MLATNFAAQGFLAVGEPARSQSRVGQLVGKKKSRFGEVTRDDLITMVQHGEMTPADAESEAVRLGLGPFASEPDPNDYSPMRAPFWTLPMTVAWIAYRAEDAVRNWWDEYRKECSFWYFQEWRVGPDGPVHQGHFLKRRSNATLVRLQMADAMRDVARPMSVAEAIDVLWQALRSGHLDASGIDEDTGQRVPIPAQQWHDLTWFEERDRDVIRAKLGPGNNTARYGGVILPAEAVRGRWPATLPPVLTLPELMKPEGGGYMPLYCAAQWIATKGGSIGFDPCDEGVWKPAYEQLLARIASDEVKVIGMRNSERQPVPGFHFAGCRIDYPFVEEPFELLLSEDLYLSSFAYLDEQHWLKGFDDSLQNRRGRHWGRLMVLKSDVAKFWPFDVAGEAAAPLRTGAPGRPSSMHLVQAEFRARCERAEVNPSVTREAELLARWLGETHPKAPRVTAKTIENNIRAEHRRQRRP